MNMNWVDFLLPPVLLEREDLNQANTTNKEDEYERLIVQNQSNTYNMLIMSSSRLIDSLRGSALITPA
jgi:hypothetical protein